MAYVAGAIFHQRSNGQRAGSRGHMRKSGGFTRLEVAVVFTILAVATAIIVPFLLRSRTDENLARCKANLHTVGTALLAYAQANDGTLPMSPTVESPHLELIHTALNAKYLSDPKLLYCPSNLKPEFSYSDENYKAGIIGYFYYSAVDASANKTLSKFLLTGIPWPHELNTHLNPQSWVMSDAWYSGNPTAHSSYKKGVNYLMLDGAVGFVTEGPRQAFH